MPNLGDIKSRDGNRYIWAECADCKEQRWVKLIGGKTGRPYNNKPIYGKLRNTLCLRCSLKYRKPPVWSFFKSGTENPRWNGGRIIDKQGYIKIKLFPESPFFCMADRRNKYVPEHRLLIAQLLGRCLRTDEFVHHRDGDKQNNSIDNLELMGRSKHSPYNHWMDKMARLEAMNKELKARLDSLCPDKDWFTIET